MSNKNIPHPTTGEVEQYILKPTSEAKKWLSEGFIPFASPLWNNKQGKAYQAFIKPERILLHPKLKGMEKICFYLSHQGHKSSEIARMLNLTAKTVSNYIWTAKQKIK